MIQSNRGRGLTNCVGSDNMTKKVKVGKMFSAFTLKKKILKWCDTTAFHKKYILHMVIYLLLYLLLHVLEIYFILWDHQTEL